MNNIEIKLLSKNFKNVKALKDVNFLFESNQITGLIGFNGSGKTTTFNIITDFLIPSAGQVLFNGQKRTSEFYKKIAYVNAADSYDKNPEKAINEILFYANLFGLAKKEAMTKIIALAKLLDCERYLKKNLYKLSKGNKQKMRIIWSLLNPHMEILLLDEPFDGLDPLVVDRLKKYLIAIAKDKIVIITSHRIDIIDDVCDGYYILREGVVVKETKASEDDQYVKVEVNYEINLKTLEKKSYVVKVYDDGKLKSIVIKTIKDYKKLSKDLLLDKKYVYHTIRRKTAQDEFLERYSDA